MTEIDTYGMSGVRYQRKMSTDEQLEALAELVPLLFIKRKDSVRGPFTTSDYVTWKLNQIFTPMGWSFLITEGPDVIDLSGAVGYVRTKGRLEVVFADGTVSAKDEVGVTPIYGTKDGSGGRYDLRETMPEVHETALKAAVSDCLKACAERFGLCFRPLIDQDLEHSIRAVQNRVRATKDGRPAKSAEDLIEEIYGKEPEPVKHWIEDDKVRPRFWAWTGTTLSLTKEEVHIALGVESVKDFKGTMAKAKAKINAFVDEKAKDKPKGEKDPFQ